MAAPEPRTPSRLSAGFVVFCVAATGLQLWLAAPDEVVASPNPYDQRLYIEMAEHIAEGRWLGPYGPRALAREPGYPLWLALASRSGLRLRTAAELLLAASAFGFALALLRVGVAAPTAGAAFAVLVLQPNAYLVNREVLPAGFYLPVLLVALAGLLFGAASRRPVVRAAHAAWGGLAFGVLWVTRPETLLIPGLLLSAAVAELLLRRGEPVATRLRDAALLVAVPGCLIAIVAGSVAALNQHSYGLAVVSERRAPGYLAAQRALLRIAYKLPRRFVPVPQRAREAAYAVSPAFRQLEAQLEGPSWARSVSCVQTRVCRDLAAGVFPWMLREAAAATGRMPTAPLADAYFQRIADQVGAACDTGELPCRRFQLAFLHPYTETWLPYLGEGLRKMLARIASAGEAAERRPPRDDVTLGRPTRDLFDALANRRAERTSDRWMELQGSAESLDPIVGIEWVHGVQRTPLWLAGSPADEPGSVDFGLRYERPATPQRLGPRLEIERATGSVSRIALAALRRAPYEREGLRVELASVVPLEPGSELRDRIRDVLWRLHALWIRVLALAGAVAAGLWWLRRPRRPRGAPFGAALVLLAAVVGSRLLLLVLVDASAFPGDTTRYLYPVISLSSCLLLLLVDAALPLRRSTP